jgi:DNA-binding sugar fermentation-stimulating protein
MMILKIEGLTEGQIVKRPSKLIKSPYVADAIINNQEFLAHTAALGCCGLCETGSTILFAPMKNKDDPTKCTYSAQLAIINEKNNEIIIGIHPKLAEELTEKCLTNNYLSILKNVKAYKRETVIYVENKVDSRFDFSGVDENGVPFIMEVKNVPLADYEDICAKDRKGKCYDDREYTTKVAYFPDGYRKKSSDPVSPRALKHIKELTLIKKESKTRCIMCYVIQRTDINRFQPSVIDPQYREAVKLALDAGVEIITLVIKWRRDGTAYFMRDDLPIL